MKKLTSFQTTGALLILCACTLFTGCSKDGSYDNGDVTTKTIGGYVQKGPFVTGTSVQVQELDNALNPKGTSFETQITDDFGSFSLSSKIGSGYVEIIADGPYFNEITNEVSEARIKLRNIAKVADTQTVNINVLTTLQAPRLRKLISQGMSFDNAVAQSRIEVLNAFNVTIDGVQSFDKMNIVGSGANNAVLLAVSAIMQQGRNAGELTEFIAKVANDISDNGTLDAQALKNAIAENSSNIDPLEVRKNLIQRYKSLGHTNIEVPDFYDYLDSDGDGKLNGNTPYLRIDNDYYEVNANAQTLEILFATNANLVLDIPSGSNWLRKDIGKSTNNKLVLSIDQNTLLQDRDANITLRTSDNALSETITVYQKLEGVKFAIELNIGGTRSRASIGGATENNRPLIENLNNITLLCFDQSGKILFAKRDNAPVYGNGYYSFAVSTPAGVTLPLANCTLYSITNCPYDFSTFSGSQSEFLSQDLSLDLNNSTDVELLMVGSVKFNMNTGEINTIKCTMEHPISKIETEIEFQSDVPVLDQTVLGITFKNAIMTTKGSIFSSTKTGYPSGNYTVATATDGKYSFYCYQNSRITEIEVKTSGGTKTVPIHFNSETFITCTTNVIYKIKIQINQDTSATGTIYAVANDTGRKDVVIEM